jgi:trigger factor
MNITEEKTGDLTATLKIEVAENDYIQNYRRELNNYRRQAVMPGFRPGKVPASLIEKKYGTAILMEELNKLVSETLTNYVQQKEQKILGHPLPNFEISHPDYERQKDFDFYFDVAYTPEIDLKLDEMEPVDCYKITIDDDLINDNILKIREKNGTIEKQNEVGENDTLDVDFVELDENGKEKTDGIKNSVKMLVELIKDEAIKEMVIGSNKGDVVIFNPLKATNNNLTDVSLMLKITKEDAQKLESDFQFTIKSIERNLPAEMNEDFFKKVFPHKDVTTEEKFMQLVAEELTDIYQKESENYFGTLALDKLYTNLTIDLPESFLKKWIYHNNEGKVSMEEIEKNFEGYSKMMKFELFQNKLIQDYPEMKVNDNALKEVIKNYFRSYLMPQGDSESDNEMIEQQLNIMAENYLKEKTEEAEKLSEDIFNRRLSELLNRIVPKKEIAVSMDEFNEHSKTYLASTEKKSNHEHEETNDSADTADTGQETPEENKNDEQSG